jgi:choline dehydrogenase-like flavoprotein
VVVDDKPEVVFENTVPRVYNGAKMIFGIENIPDRIRRGNPVPYQVITHDIVEEADVCIIGSGAAGAILASKLVSGIDGIEGKKVVLIEKGGYYDPEDFNQKEDSMMRLLWKNAGIQMTTDFGIQISQGECVGGSTMINDAVCFDTPPLIKQQWRDLGVNIDDEKWKGAIDEVRDRISVTRLTIEEINKNNNAMKLKNACDNHLPHPYVGERNERNCIDCKTCGDCHLGCHYQTKQDMCNTYIYDALDPKYSEKFKIYSNCDVRKINYEGDTATGVQGKFLQQGKEKFSITINAKVVILAAGSIASSSILLNNNIAKGKAGKGLALHPSTLLMGKFEEEVRASEGIPMAYSCHEFSVLNYQNNGRLHGGFMLESIFTPIYQFALLLPWKPDDKPNDQKEPVNGLMSDFQKKSPLMD